MTKQLSKQDIEEQNFMRATKKEIENILGRILTEEEYNIIFMTAFLKGENYGIIRLADELEIGGNKNEK